MAGTELRAKEIKLTAQVVDAGAVKVPRLRLMPAGMLAARAIDPMMAPALIGLALFGFQFWINNVQTLPSDFFSVLFSLIGPIGRIGSIHKEKR